MKSILMKPKTLLPFYCTKVVALTIMILCVSTSSTMLAKAKLNITDLQTEYKTNPIGLDIIQPRLFWKITSPTNNTVQTSYEIKAANTLSQLKTEKNLLWQSAKINSNHSTHIIYNGQALKSKQQVFWQVRVTDNHGNTSPWSPVASFETGILQSSDWQASWIESTIEENDTLPYPCQLFRKEINLNKKISNARIYSTCHGLYQLSINGQKVSDELFAPGWTSYKEMLQYQTYDVTKLLTQGNNCVGVTLGDGWYRGPLVWQGNKNLYGNKAAILLQIEVTYTDGSSDIFITNNSWKSTTSPILKSEIYDGEFYDARLEKTGWNMTGYDDTNWTKCIEKARDKNVIVASYAPPVRITQSISPIKKIITPRGEVVFDFGQNLVGWVQFRLQGERGSKITIQHAEVLDQEGNFYTDNLRIAQQQDAYIFKGEGMEEYQPHFTFHGFRYIKITDYNNDISLDDITAKVIHSDMKPLGDFTCSDTLINRLQKNIQWGLRGNFLDVPTDCPQRDERLGWTGDAQVFASTACFNMNTATFYTKWLKNLTIDQREDGSVPWVVPNVIEDGGGTGWSDGYGATGWADAAVIIPWTVYQAYGDKRILEDQYLSMKAWEEYMILHSTEDYIFDYGFHFGDWLSFAEYMSYYYNAPDYGFAGAHTDKELIATAYFYHTTSLMHKIALLLDHKEDAERYANLLPKIKSAFEKEFVTPTGRLSSNTQTAYILALSFDIMPDKLRESAAQRLASNVEELGHLTTGFLGTPLICEALSDNGYPTMAYQLLFNKRYPSWLYAVTKGATTIWERWDGIKPDGSFQDAGMNSFNHYAYGAIGNWLYTQVAGLQIDPLQPGYKHIIIKPIITNHLTFAKATHTSGYGTITSHWKKQDNALSLTVSIPANTTASVYVPSMDAAKITYNKIPLEKTNIPTTATDDGYIKLEIGSGNYLFTSKK